MEEVHTPGQPYCDDVTCWCHTDASYHEVATHPAATDEEVAQAYEFYELDPRKGK